MTEMTTGSHILTKEPGTDVESHDWVDRSMCLSPSRSSTEGYRGVLSQGVTNRDLYTPVTSSLV